MLKIKPFSSLSKTLRELGYRVRIHDNKEIAVSNSFRRTVFYGERRECWNWLLKNKEIRRPW